MASFLFLEFFVFYTASESTGSVPFELVLCALFAIPVDHLYGLHCVASAEICIYKLYKATYIEKSRF